MPEFTNRSGIEAEITTRLQSEYDRILSKLIADIEGAGANLTTLDFELLGENFEAWVARQLEGVYIASAEQYQTDLSFMADAELLRDTAEAWADQRARLLVQGLDQTTNRRVSRYVRQFRDGGMTNEMLIDRLTSFMSRNRAEVTAITEVTRAASEGQEFVARELRKQGIQMTTLWNTLVDERVCPICSPRDRQAQGTNWFDLPPAHPRCRCFVTYEVKDNV